MNDWFGGISYHPDPDGNTVTILMRTWPLDSLDGDWWQVWRERMADLSARYPGYRVAMFCARRGEHIAGFVP